MKKAVFIVVCSLFFLTFAFAQESEFIAVATDTNDCFSSDQIIMKLFESENSHGALWDDANYDYDICYEQIFGIEHFGNNPHECVYDEEVFDSGFDDYSIEISKGWNIISPKTKTLTREQLDEDCNVSGSIWSYSENKYIVVGGSMEGGLGYYVYVADSCILNYEGERYTDGAPKMEVGWNYVGVGLNTPINELNTGDMNCQIIGTIWEWDTALSQYAQITTSYFEGGKGYSIYCEEGETTVSDLNSIYSGVSSRIPRIPENVLFWLNNETNSHASVDWVSGSYDIPVCYGDLSCVARDNSCEEGEVVVASLYQEDNSHIASGDFSDYPIKICCGKPGDIYWADADGVKITDQEINVGDRIQAVMTGLTSGSFYIKEEDVLGDDDIVDIIGEVIGRKLVGKWEILQADLDKTEDLEEFYFQVDGWDNKSDSISINDSYNDSPMNITIISPECGEDFDEGSSVTVKIAASDEDDFIEGNVSINGVVVENFTNGGVAFNYTFDSFGNYQIVVNAINTREKKVRRTSNVVVLDRDADGEYVDGKYVAACILKPEDLSDLDDSIVEFDASTTKGIEVIGGSVSRMIPDEYPDRFNWDWEFFPEDISGVDGYKFSINFPVVGDNSASLRVDFD